ncbi:MAG TPA: DUF2147 domain-containing protein [Chitinophagaceae bacterium]|nr:DUF2147 domain-containing protein [Chitinophagaceae bacterium]
MYRRIRFFLTSVLFLCVATAFCNDKENPDAIIGTWLNATGKGHIQIYKQGNKYFGKLVWLKEPNDEQGNPKVDSKNPNASLKTKPLIGATILRDFVFDDDEWNSGRIYDPQNGKDYKCFLRLKDSKTLLVRGYVGVSLLGRTETWTRIN